MTLLLYGKRINGFFLQFVKSHWEAQEERIQLLITSFYKKKNKEPKC